MLKVVYQIIILKIIQSQFAQVLCFNCRLKYCTKLKIIKKYPSGSTFWVTETVPLEAKHCHACQKWCNWIMQRKGKKILKWLKIRAISLFTRLWLTDRVNLFSVGVQKEKMPLYCWVNSRLIYPIHFAITKLEQVGVYVYEWGNVNCSTGSWDKKQFQCRQT